MTDATEVGLESIRGDVPGRLGELAEGLVAVASWRDADRDEVLNELGRELVFLTGERALGNREVQERMRNGLSHLYCEVVHSFEGRDIPAV